MPISMELNGMSSEELKRLFRRKGGGGRSSGKSSSKGSSSRAITVAQKHGASEEFTNSRGATSFTLPGTETSAMAYADGGGKSTTLGSSSAFSGRQAGGGSRGTIYGTSRFGSGYPYGGFGSYVSYRPFPYYFFPVPVSDNYYGGNEYLNVSDSQRPGGNLVTAIVQPSYNSSSVVYRLVGDNSSVTAVFDALVANCSVTNSSSAITTFTPSNFTWPLPEQIIQYYRASSFALSLDGYNNTVSLPANAPASNDSTPTQMADTPLPSGLNMTFLQCVNLTIGASVPLADVDTPKLSGGRIAGIVVGSVLGFIVVAVLTYCRCGCCSGKSTSSVDKKRKPRSKTGAQKYSKIELSPYSYPSSSSYYGTNGGHSAYPVYGARSYAY